MHHKHTRTISYRSTDKQGKQIPCIPIQGTFLKGYDFSVGDKVHVSYSNGLIFIEKIISNRPPDEAAMAIAR